MDMNQNQQTYPQPQIYQQVFHQPQAYQFYRQQYPVTVQTNQQQPPTYSRQMPFFQNPEDPAVNNNFEFNDESIRKSFIRKVYSILACQLAITFSIISVFVFHEPTKLFVRQNQELFWIALGILIVTMIVLACCESVRRSFPTNFIVLALFTLAESFMLGVVSSIYDPDIVLMAVGITGAVCLGLTLFAFQTKWDFTVMGGVLFVAVIILLLFGIVAMFFPGKTLMLVYASCGALLFCIFLIYDTQMMMGGKHKYSISPEEYIFAALTLYIDIINIFTHILMILGLTSD